MAIKLDLEPAAVEAGLRNGMLEWHTVNGQRVLRPTAKFNARLRKVVDRDRRPGVDHVLTAGIDSAHRSSK